MSAITCIDIEGENPYLLLINQACYHENKEQNESLIHPYQAMEHGVTFCLTPKDKLNPEGETGKQKMVVEEVDIPLLYDGRKMFIPIRKPTDNELITLEKLEITSPEPFSPEHEYETDNITRRETKKNTSNIRGVSPWMNGERG